MKKYKFFCLNIIFLFFICTVSWASVAKITKIQGEVSYLSVNKYEWESAALNMELELGGQLKTSVDSIAEIKFNSGHSALLSEKSSMVISKADKDNTKLDIFEGKLRSKVKKLIKNQAYIIKTPQAVCAVRGTDFSVEVMEGITRVEVFEGIVEAKETISGEKTDISAGYYSEIISNKTPSKPKEIPGIEKQEKIKGQPKKTKHEINRLSREEVRTEIFEEISRESVISRSVNEIKRAEYENGKVLIDAEGKRVRQEEYIVRPSATQFKYVVLNHRQNKFDFGKIIFTFNKNLPQDLTRVTNNMFYTEKQPEYILTDMDSVISNTQDSINEQASDGQMIPDDINSPTSWSHYFGQYHFYIKGKGKDRLEMWSYSDSNDDGMIQSS
ncbi:MAG: FecR family protein [Elusimicrobiota bacterium]